LYLKYFGLDEAPFSITPDPAFIYLSAAHRDALAHLLYGVGQGGAGGFVQLTGEVGTGKTTLCRCLMEQIPDETQVALVLNPLMTPRELLATICEELGLDTEGIADSNKAMVDCLNSHLLKQHAKGNRVVVVVDEAQNLSPEALEQVRLLTNLETAKDKLLQMVLLGQPELRELLQRQNLRQLAQRITARYHLAPLNQDESQAYVRHRMMVAGAQRNPFRRPALRALYQRSGGVPRLINIIADRALVAAYSREAGSVSAAMVHAAANEVQPSERRVRSNYGPGLVAAASVLALAAISVVMWGPGFMDRVRPEPVTVPVTVEAKMPEPTQNLVQQTPPQSMPKATPQPTPQPQQLPVGGYAEEPAARQRPQTRLETGWLDEQHRTAWQTMAELWQDRARANDIQAACDSAPGTGFSCVKDNGNWSRIRQLGLPVLLVLWGEERRLLPFMGFSENGLLVGRGEDMIEVSREAVERHWLGEYIITWPQAPGWPGEIQRGESGAAVDIVMEMAAFAKPAWNGGGIFDAGFESWLMTFQQRNGLKADGIIGPNTLIYLMSPTITEPRLILAPEENS